MVQLKLLLGLQSVCNLRRILIVGMGIDKVTALNSMTLHPICYMRFFNDIV